MNKDSLYAYILKDREIGLSMLNNGYGDRFRKMIKNIALLNDADINSYLDNIYHKINDYLDNYDGTVRFEIFVEFIIREEMLNDIINNNFHSGIILSDIAESLIKKSNFCTENSKSCNLNKILAKLNKQQIRFLIQRYFYLKDIKIIEKIFNNSKKLESQLIRAFKNADGRQIIQFIQRSPNIFLKLIQNNENTLRNNSKDNTFIELSDYNITKSLKEYFSYRFKWSLILGTILCVIFFIFFYIYLFF